MKFTRVFSPMSKKNAYYVETRWGGSEESPPLDRLREIIAELDIRDEEHPDTWMGHADSDWLLRLDEDRFAYLQNSEDETIAHLSAVSPATALTLWRQFAEGGRDAVSGYGWISGPRPISAQEQSDRARRATQALLALDCEFYAQLGPELTDAVCRTDGCTRGRIQYSVLCKAHHFEKLRGRPCPFSD
jgi:hypothetical protein